MNRISLILVCFIWSTAGFASSRQCELIHNDYVCEVTQENGWVFKGKMIAGSPHLKRHGKWTGFHQKTNRRVIYDYFEGTILETEWIYDWFDYYANKTDADTYFPARYSIKLDLPTLFLSKDLWLEREQTRVSRANILDAYLTIALGSEFGKEPPIIAKWSKKVRFSIHEAIETDYARREINRVLKDISEVTGIEFSEVDYGDEKEQLTVDITYLDVLPILFGDRWTDGNDGYFATFWSEGRMIRAKVGVGADIEGLKPANLQKYIKHGIREEITQSMGLQNDINSIPTSIFYGRQSFINKFSDLDRLILCIHYQPEILPNASWLEVADALVEYRLIDRCRAQLQL